MAVLGVILEESLGGTARDRVVVVSQSTAALDLVQQLCDMRDYKTVRIDGSTDVTKRQVRAGVEQVAGVRSMGRSLEAS